MPFDDGAFYLVEIRHAGVPLGLEVRLELFRGNEGGHGGLNPALYEPASK